MRRALFAAMAAVCAVTATAAAGEAGAAAGPGWSVVVTPNPRDATASDLAGVACSSAGACTAVGEYQTHAGFFTLAERWNGTAFSVQPVPRPARANSALSGVSCPAVAACTAVGFYTTGPFHEFALAERWNGSAWSIQPTPNQPGTDQLAGVSCPTPSACTAVGSYTLGDQTFPLAESWNGTAWSIQPVPVPGPARPFTSSLAGVSCTAVNACIAVGTFFNGSTGEDLPLGERWNGTTWSIQAVPSPTDEGGKLFSVSCTATTACTAAGQFLDHATAQDFTLAERWNGTTWAIQNSPTAPGAADAFLHGVSCPAATACTAVGDFFTNTSTDLDHTLAQHWDGTTWAIQPTPNPSGGGDALAAVACPSTASCIAVGAQFQGFALAERFGA